MNIDVFVVNAVYNSDAMRLCEQVGLFFPPGPVQLSAKSRKNMRCVAIFVGGWENERFRKQNARSSISIFLLSNDWVEWIPPRFGCPSEKYSHPGTNRPSFVQTSDYFFFRTFSFFSIHAFGAFVFAEGVVHNSDTQKTYWWSLIISYFFRSTSTW